MFAQMHHSEESDLLSHNVTTAVWVFMLPWLQKHGRAAVETCSVVPARACDS